MNEKLAPKEFRKIAENTSQNGDQLAAVYYDGSTGQFFIQAQNAEGNGILTFGPLARHVFENLMQILGDVKDMERRYIPLE